MLMVPPKTQTHKRVNEVNSLKIPGEESLDQSPLKPVTEPLDLQSPHSDFNSDGEEKDVTFDNVGGSQIQNENNEQQPLPEPAAV